MQVKSSDGQLVRINFDKLDTETYLYRALKRDGPFRYSGDKYPALPYPARVLQLVDKYLCDVLIDETSANDLFIDAMGFLLLIHNDNNYPLSFWLAKLHEDYWRVIHKLQYPTTCGAISSHKIVCMPPSGPRPTYYIQCSAAYGLERSIDNQQPTHEIQYSTAYGPRLAKGLIKLSQEELVDIVGQFEGIESGPLKWTKKIRHRGAIPVGATALWESINIPIHNWTYLIKNHSKTDMIDVILERFDDRYINEIFADESNMLIKASYKHNGEEYHYEIHIIDGTEVDAIYQLPKPVQHCMYISEGFYCTATCLWSLQHGADIDDKTSSGLFEDRGELIKTREHYKLYENMIHITDPKYLLKYKRLWRQGRWPNAPPRDLWGILNALRRFDQ